MIEIATILERLHRAYGPQRWWPADTSFEVIVGAVLVQRTTWENAARAIEQLKTAGYLDCRQLATVATGRLEPLTRPAGFFRLKARRLQAVAAAIAGAGGLDTLAAKDTPELRGFFLAIPGVGAETADSILLYAFGRPVVVIDAYYRRIWSRLHGTEHGSGGAFDTELRRITERSLTSSADLNELHALLVQHGKRRCRARPLCSNCPLAEGCEWAARAPGALVGASKCAGATAPAR
jgi:endonuclease-3 related protein